MTARRNIAHQELRAWAYDRSKHFELGVCLCFPVAMKQAERGYDDGWVQGHVSRFLNRLDRRLFGNAHKRKGMRIERLVVLEHAPDIGWHAHLAMPVPAEWPGQRFPNLIRKIWHDEIRRYACSTKIDTFCWIQPINGAYVDYTLKWVDTRVHNENIDDLSRCARFDEHNTHFANETILPNEGR